ncbi:MAG: YraN family protein [Syntrophomonadaceae bacterium]|nr:YraN family protein [Syntrophomonadaceae bacterium]
MKKELGKWGEESAAKYLMQQGYKILGRNYYTRYGELDIICEKDRNLVFVEVKTRRSSKYGYPEEAITNRKKEHIRKAALLYMDAAKRSYREISFDVISILLEAGEEKINHIKQAF